MAGQKISLFARFWTRFRYNTQKARESHDNNRPVNPEMWQFYTGTAIIGALLVLKVFFPWYLPNDFPPTQEEYDAYYAKRRALVPNTTS